MTSEEIDLAYSSLCEAMSRVGETRSPLLLAALCLSMITRHDNLAEVQALIQQAEAACDA